MEAKLYDLIWKRTLASQMKPAEIEITTYVFSVK
jgi:DNA topoisomerase IA